MKFSVASSTLSTLLSSSYVLTKAQSFNFAKIATDEKWSTPHVDEEEFQLIWDEKVLRLRQKLQAKYDLRKKLSAYGYLLPTRQECTHFGYDLASDLASQGTDVGVLNCPSPEHFCIEDTLSSRGGICAQVVDEALTSSLTGLEETKVDSDGVNTKLLKPLSLEMVMAAKHMQVFEKSGTECTPGSNPGYVDVGPHPGCEGSGHGCVRDSSSSLGGTCVDIGSSLTQRERFLRSSGTTYSCTFLNGTIGVKCHGWNACSDLSQEFIENNIGCGSCGGEDSCFYFNEESSSIGEESCNGYRSCHHGPFYTWIYPSGRSTVTIGNKSCNRKHGCSWVFSGSLSTGERSCVGDGACSFSSGTIQIGSQSCNKDNACASGIGDQNMTIGNNSCNNCLACSKNMGTTTILDGSCSDLYACSYTRGYTSIGASSCSGGYSCMNVTDTSIFNDSCHGVRSCSNLYNSAIGAGACNGVGSCGAVKDVNSQVVLSIGAGSCWGCYSCSKMSGEAIIGDDSCWGFNACSVASGKVSIGSESCYGSTACGNLAFDGTTVSIGSGSCNGIISCISAHRHSTVGDSACLGARTCVGIMNLTVGDDSCSAKYACTGLQGAVSTFLCNGFFACNKFHANFSDPNSNLMTIGQNSCNGYRSCSKGIEEMVGDNMCNNIGDKCYENWNMFQAGVCNTGISCVGAPSTSPTSSTIPTLSLAPTNSPPTESPVSSCFPNATKIKIQSTTGKPIQ